MGAESTGCPPPRGRGGWPRLPSPTSAPGPGPPCFLPSLLVTQWGLGRGMGRTLPVFSPGPGGGPGVSARVGEGDEDRPRPPRVSGLKDSPVRSEAPRSCVLFGTLRAFANRMEVDCAGPRMELWEPSRVASACAYSVAIRRRPSGF